MKNFITIAFLTLSSASFATTEFLFDKAIMDQCRSEVNKLGCGNAETTEDDKLMTCVDQKKSKLTPECLKVHTAMNEMRKSHSH